MNCKQCREPSMMISEDGLCARCEKWADELTYWNEIYTPKGGRKMNERIEELEAKIDEMVNEIRKLENDVDYLHTLMEKALSFRLAIKEIQDELEVDGKILLYSGRWLK